VRPSRLRQELLCRYAALQSCQVFDGVPYAGQVSQLTDRRPAGTQPQLSDFSTGHEDRKIGILMGKTMDKFGRHSLGAGRAGTTAASDWSVKRSAFSPRYTTEWDQLPR
jgi:hypothetical protein